MISENYDDAPWLRPREKPALPRVSNAYKHGLYSKSVVFTTPAQHELYSHVLHDFTHEYRPVTPSETTLVQQLATLQFRHLKVQELHAEAMRLEVLQQAQAAYKDPAGNPPTELTLEARAFDELAQRPSFQLYIRELDRLPNKIQKVMSRLALQIRLRLEIVEWPDLDSKPIPEPPPLPAPAPIALQQTESKEKPKPEDSAMANLMPDPLDTKEKFFDAWKRMSPTTHDTVMNAPEKDYRRLAFFRLNKLPEAQFWKWLEEGEDPPIAA
jgi:hypothetical protein